MRFVDYLIDYTDSRRLGIAPRTFEAEKRYIRLYIAPAIGNLDMVEVSRSDILSLLSSIYEAGKRRTAEALFVYLKAALKDSPNFNDIFHRLSRPKNRKKPLKILTRRDVSALIGAAARPLDALLFTLAGVYGLRRGEIAGLMWSDFDVSSFTIQRQRVPLDSGVIVTDCKTASSVRTLPITPALSSLLASLEHPDQYCFPFHPCHLDHILRDSLKRCGLPSVTLHSLRHTAATTFIEEQTPLATVKSILGHSDIKTTADTYVHITPTAIRNAFIK